MKKIKENILSWCNNPEEGSVRQALNISELPCLVGNVCLMPDTHEGYGMPIGGVVALKNAISPNMVGVDIGCGMLAVKTSLTDISREDLQFIVGLIKARIPVGFNHRLEREQHKVFEDELWKQTTVCLQEYQSAQFQIGTLGSGNHFIEIQKGSDGYIWFMIHSGSRNLGKKVADYYNKIAKKYCESFGLKKIIEDELCFLPNTVKEFDDYIKEMNVCLRFSNANRDVMRFYIEKCFTEVIPDVTFETPINIQHNYARSEYHFGQNMWVHRKGATSAQKDEIGIIPGSQGTESFIVKGLGNEASLQSCSHGSGRKLSRKKAKETLDLQKEIDYMNERGIIHDIDSKDKLDEAPSSYKDINVVMEEQKDLVDVLVKLTPLASIKG